MKKKAWKDIAVLFLAVAVIFTLIISVSNKDLKEKDGKNINIDVEYIQIEGLDKNNYPETTIEVVNLNSSVLKIVLSQKLEDLDLEYLVEKQRTLFSKRLLEELDEQIHMNLFIDEVIYNSTNNIILVDIRNEILNNESKKENNKIINVIQIFENQKVNNVKYYLIEEDNKYKIDNWVFLEE